MNSLMRPATWLVCLALGAGSLTQAQTRNSANLLSNGGFEDWEPLLKAPAGVVTPQLVDRLVPSGWELVADAYERKNNATFPLTVTISRDVDIRHGGAASLKIVNQSATDIGLAQFPTFRVEPRRKYRARIWCKAQDVVATGAPGGLGVCFFVCQGPEDYWSDPTLTCVTPKVHDGTFDWRLVEVVFTTKPNTAKAVINVQLRRATGTVWFDDVELFADATGK